MRNIKVLALALYGDVAASTRIRINQFSMKLKEDNITLQTYSLLGNDYLTYKSQKKQLPFFSILGSYIQRAFYLLFRYDHDLIFLHLELFPFFPSFVERIFLKNKKYIYDFDDAFYLKYKSGRFKFLETLLGKKFDEIIKNAKLVTAGSQELYSYAVKFNPNVILMPSSVDTEQFYKIFEKKYDSFNEKNPLILGWIGSSSTQKYLNILKSPIEELGEQISIKLVIVGGKIGKLKNIKVEEMDWSNEMENDFLNSIDIGLMPLSDDQWSRGKCGYKLLQYMSCGKPVIASKVGANKTIVNDVCGILVESNQEWKRAILKFYNNPTLISIYGKEAYLRAETRFSANANFSIIRDAIIEVNDLD